jgi:hypothetical protein
VRGAQPQDRRLSLAVGRQHPASFCRTLL